MNAALDAASNSACTLGSQEVGKTTLPSFSSCWPIAPLVERPVDQAGRKQYSPRLRVHRKSPPAMVRELAPLIGYVPSISLPLEFDCCAGSPAKGG